MSAKKKTPPKKKAVAKKKTVAKTPPASPKRPRGVPAPALFDATENEWQLGAKKGKMLVGDWTWWRPDGTLGGRYASARELADTIAAQWTGAGVNRYVVLTGGEPLLQVDAALIDALHGRGFSIGVETNGTIEPPDGMDWICVSPKAGAELTVRRGHELKLIYPQADAAPETFVDLAFERFSLQPMDGPDIIDNTARAVDYCLRHPQWRLSLQTHKTLGIR